MEIHVIIEFWTSLNFGFIGAVGIQPAASLKLGLSMGAFVGAYWELSECVFKGFFRRECLTDVVGFFSVEKILSLSKYSEFLAGGAFDGGAKITEISSDGSTNFHLK